MSAGIIEVRGVSKEYRLGTLNHGVLYKDLQSWWARLRGREDPNAPIHENDLTGGRSQDDENERFLALDDITFDLQESDTLGVIGRNGAGKSTLLKILSRVTAPTTGRVRIRGRVTSLLEVGTGFHPELTGRENIFLNGAILGMSKAEITRKFDEIAAFAEIDRFLDTPVKRYSSGMYVRLAFAVAAHLEPEVLIVDEVLSVGDLAFQRKCMGKMDSIHGEGRTIIFVSHNLTAVSQLCKRGILLDKGRIAMDGPSTDVVAHYVRVNDLERRPAREYPHDPAKLAQVRQAAVHDALGQVSGTLSLHEPFSIHIEYELNDDASGVTVGIQILQQESGQSMLSVTDAELDPTKLDRRARGVYRSEMKVPEKLLNTGSYRVYVGIGRAGQVLDGVDNVSFSIIDQIGIIQHLGFERKPSAFALQLPWRDL